LSYKRWVYWATAQSNFSSLLETWAKQNPAPSMSWSGV